MARLYGRAVLFGETRLLERRRRRSVDAIFVRNFRFRTDTDAPRGFGLTGNPIRQLGQNANTGAAISTNASRATRAAARRVEPKAVAIPARLATKTGALDRDRLTAQSKAGDAGNAPVMGGVRITRPEIFAWLSSTRSRVPAVFGVPNEIALSSASAAPTK
jgi:hypothetical protein